MPSQYSPGASTTDVQYVDNGAGTSESLAFKLTLPADYDESTPSPLMLYFHGWGGSHTECGSFCTSEAADVGFITVSLTGLGGSGWSSWNGFGSTASPGPLGAICEEGAQDYCYDDCGACDDGCWWTSCGDSVAQAAAMMDFIEASFCVDLDMVWAAGCSNGGSE